MKFAKLVGFIGAASVLTGCIKEDMDECPQFKPTEPTVQTAVTQAETEEVEVVPIVIKMEPDVKEYEPSKDYNYGK